MAHDTRVPTSIFILLIASACLFGSGCATRQPAATMTPGRATGTSAYSVSGTATVIADSGNVLEVRSRLVNSDAEPLRIGLNFCSSPSVRIYRPGDHAPRPAFDARRLPAWRDADTGLFLGLCPSNLTLRTLASGESIEFSHSLPVAKVLGDSLPDGPYRVEATLQLTLFQSSMDPTGVQVDTAFAAGTVTLTKP